MNIPLLHRLREADGSYLQLSALGEDLAAVRADLAELIAFGFVLEQHPYQGIAYRGPAERLCPDQVEWQLATRRVGRRVAVWNRVTSTNDLAARAAGSRTNDGLVILAEEQTSGRGRRGRTWVAPARSSLLMSVVLFPPESLDRPAWLTALGAVAVAELVEAATGHEARIKWPNDVRVRGRKIAGVLVERGSSSIVGIGLNVNLSEQDLPEDLAARATSIRLLTGEQFDRSELAHRLIVRLDELYDQGVTRGPDDLTRLWQARFEPLGRLVRVQTASAEYRGRLVDADLQRGLVLDGPRGGTGWIASPEVLALSCEDEPAPAG